MVSQTKTLPLQCKIRKEVTIMRYVLRYASTYYEGDKLEDFAYILGLKIVHNIEEGNYQVFINYNKSNQTEIACYSDIESNGVNGYSYEEIQQGVFSEGFFRERLNYSNLHLYKLVF